MQKYFGLMIQLIFLAGCVENNVSPDVGSNQNSSTKPLIKNEKYVLLPGGGARHQSSIQINGKKFLRYQPTTPWYLFDTEVSQYVTATNSLVLSCNDLQTALADAGLSATITQWRQIALHTYQAEFEMSLTEANYRRLQKTRCQVEWLLDYSPKRQAEEM